MAIQPATYDINLRREDAYRASLTFTRIDDDVRTPLNLNDYEIKSEARYTSNNGIWFNLPFSIQDAENCVISIYFTSSNTRDLYDQSLQLSGIYDLQLKDPITGDITTVLCGKISLVNDITEEVTRTII